MVAKLTLTDGEIEILYMQAALASINEAVNNDKIELRGKGYEKEVWFKTSNHQAVYSILLVDFLSKPDNTFFSAVEPIIKFLKFEENQPHFNFSQSVSELKSTAVNFDNWLSGEIVIEKLWLPSINLECDLKITRKELLEISGTTLKHNFFKLSRQAKRVQNILNRNGHAVSDQDIFPVFDDFNEYIRSGGFLTYMGQTVVEFLNNLRSDIHDYLSVEYSMSIREDKSEQGKYSYRYPDFVKSSFGQTMYWDLMNQVRKGPYMERFVIPSYMKMRY
jgi:hypothetical protein